MFIILLAVVAKALYQSQAGVYDWTLRLFGPLLQAEAFNNEIIYQSATHYGLISKATGQVVTRDPKYVPCDDYDFVYYDPVQKAVLHPTAGPILEQQLDEPILYCLRGQQNEYILVTSTMIYSNGAKSFSQSCSSKPLFAGYLMDRAYIFLASNDQICAYGIDSLVYKAYCFQNNEANPQFEQLGASVFIKGSASSLVLTQEGAIPVKFKASEIIQTVFYLRHFVIKSPQGQYIADIDGNVLYRLQENDYVVPNFKSNKQYVIVNKQKTAIKVTLHELQSNTSTSFTQTLSSDSPLLSAYMIDQQKKQVLVQLEDLHTVFFDKTQIIWSNEQSLIDVKDIFYEKYENPEITHKNSYYESLEKHGPKNPLYVFPYLITRITEEIKDIGTEVISKTSRLGASKERESEMEKFYALRQKIYFLTSLNTIICYDSNDVSLLAKYQIHGQDSSYEFQARYLIQTNILNTSNQTDPTDVHVFIFHSKEQQRLNIFMLDLNHQILKHVASYRSSNILWTLPYKVQPTLHYNMVIIINSDHEVITYPRFQKDLPEPILLYRHIEEAIIGYSLMENQKIVEIWRVHLHQQILSIRSSFHYGEENPRVAIWDDRKVLFKLIDFSNFAVLTTDQDKLQLVIINARTGKVIFQGIQTEADFEKPVNLVFDEHQVFVTYYNKAQMIYEVWTVEIYHAKIEVSFIKMLENHYFSKTDLRVNYYKSDLEALFLQHVYGYPLGIKSLTISQTLKSLTKKNLIIVTPNGQVHSLDRNLVSARRRDKAVQVVPEYSLQSAELQPYHYMLPINYQAVLSYNQRLDFSRFSIEPTNFESSSLMLVYGQDIFFSRIAPDKTYDMLSDDFNYLALIVTMVAILIAKRLMARLAKSSKKLKRFYLN